MDAQTTIVERKNRLDGTSEDFLCDRLLIEPGKRAFPFHNHHANEEMFYVIEGAGTLRFGKNEYPVRAGDVMVVFSHGGLNAVAIEVAMEARTRDLKTVAVTSLDNHRNTQPTHSSGKKLADVVDLVIDNCVPAQDALVPIQGWKAPVGAGSTVAAVTISMALVAQLAAELARRGLTPPVFVSPNVPDIPADNNRHVFQAYGQSLRR